MSPGLGRLRTDALDDAAVWYRAEIMLHWEVGSTSFYSANTVWILAQWVDFNLLHSHWFTKLQTGVADAAPETSPSLCVSCSLLRVIVLHGRLA